MDELTLQLEPTYARIYLLVQQIPPGKVATYGQIASMAGGCTARMVGYALAALHSVKDVPWQRVINAQGKISLRADGGGSTVQRRLLEEEGLRFDAQDRIDLRKHRWSGPEMAWLLENGFDPDPLWREG